MSFFILCFFDFLIYFCYHDYKKYSSLILIYFVFVFIYLFIYFLNSFIVLLLYIYIVLVSFSLYLIVYCFQTFYPFCLPFKSISRFLIFYPFYDCFYCFSVIVSVSSISASFRIVLKYSSTFISTFSFSNGCAFQVFKKYL